MVRSDFNNYAYINYRFGVAPIVEKMVESRLRWFGHVWRRSVDAPIRQVDQIEDSPVVRGRGRPWQTIGHVKRDLEINGLFMEQIHDRALWRRLIYVADPT